MPTVCAVCGDPLGSKSKATHHRRLCRPRLVGRLAAVMAAPIGLQVVGRTPDGGHATLVRHAPGFAVTTPTGTETFAGSDEAAARFLLAVRPTA